MTEPGMQKLHAAILSNAESGRFHPIYFRPAPRPSDDAVEGETCRHRSLGHHTLGFETLEAAQGFIAEDESAWPTGIVLNWSGQGIPAVTLDLPLDRPVAMPEETASPIL
jgi:hypothetical protein